MKVALNAMQVRAAKSGVGQYIHGLVEALLQQEHFDRFVLYCSAQNIENYQFKAKNLETIAWGMHERSKYLRLLYESLRFPKEVLSQEVDVLHGLSNFLPPKKVCPYVVTIHDLSYHVQPERCPFVRRQYWYAMTRRTVSLADRIITVSENSRRDIERFFPAAAPKITVIPNAAHPRFRPVEYGREKSAVAARGIVRPYILFVGTLEPGKNVSRLIRAFDMLSGDFPDHLLLIAGDRGWLYQDIYRAAYRAKARERIQFLGHLPDSDIVDFLNFCDVLAFPSLYEGFGLPPLEAMACGAPVVASEVSSIPEVVGDAAVLADPFSERDLAKAIRRVLSDDSLREELRQKGIERAAQFTWAKAARETLQVYRSLLSRET